MPRLEFSELTGVDKALQDNGLVCLFNATLYSRRVDSEDTCRITREKRCLLEYPTTIVRCACQNTLVWYDRHRHSDAPV